MPTLESAIDVSDFFESAAEGVTVVDTGFMRPGFDAAYIVVDAGRAAIIDSGTYLAVPRILAALNAQGLNAEDVDWVIPTHVHLDHAGGAGILMQQLPRARMAVHPRGARHMIDPAKLLAGARAVYGDEVVQRDYGDVIGVSAERVVNTSDDMVLHVGQRPLRIIDTPGHARHHNCIWDEATRGWFTGDTFGISYRELLGARGRYGFPTTTPVQFDPSALRHSIERMLGVRPEVVYLTHYGKVTDVERQAEQVLRQLDAMVELAHSAHGSPERGSRLRTALRSLYVAEMVACGIDEAQSLADRLLAIDIELNAQGLEIWLDQAIA
jgi:glyoxylase-like metal-dependent hydrolase (beta-lactamase superfamily II)